MQKITCINRFKRTVPVTLVDDLGFKRLTPIDMVHLPSFAYSVTKWIYYVLDVGSKKWSEVVVGLEERWLLCHWSSVFISRFACSYSSTPPPGGGGGEALPYKGLTGTCGPTGYGFQDFCLERGIYFAPFCLKRGIFTWTNALNRISKYVYFIGTLPQAEFLQVLP